MNYGFVDRRVPQDLRGGAGPQGFANLLRQLTNAHAARQKIPQRQHVQAQRYSALLPKLGRI